MRAIHFLGLPMAAGAVLVHQCGQLPPWPVWPALALSLAVAARLPAGARLRCLGPALLAVVAGGAWAAWIAGGVLAARLPSELEGRPLEVRGCVAGLPRRGQRSTSFDFLVDHGPVRGRLRLRSYRSPDAAPAAGECRVLQVRLKRPHGLRNPGGFDFEAWSFARRVVASGYVLAVGARLNGGRTLDRWRAWLLQKLQHHAGSARYSGIVQALAVGERSAIPVGQWDLLLATGTNHLVAISGLHVGLAAGFGFFLAGWTWRRSSRACLWIPAPRVAALAAGACALGYAALAGFGIPVQRALVMLSVGLLGGRPRPAWVVLDRALAAVILVDPLSPLEAGSWLSFGAVAILLTAIRPARHPAARPWRRAWDGLREFARLQLWFGVALMPLSVFWFQRICLVAPLANLVAVPVVGLLVTPAVLLAVLAAALGLSAPAAMVLAWANGLLGAVFIWLDWLSGLPAAQWWPGTAAPWQWLLALTGLLLAGGAPALGPRARIFRRAGIALLLPLALGSSPRPVAGQARVTVLDVGQGLAVVVETAQHLLVYDAGAAFGPRFDSGSAVVLPYLRSQGWRRLDLAIISHADGDHAGGMPSLLRAFAARRVVVGEPLAQIAGTACRDGESWRWDGVDFELLRAARDRFPVGNNASCLLLVGAGGNRLLIAGDLERGGEADLLARDRLAPVAVLVVPHHGSRTSSSSAWIRGLIPDRAIISAGYRNRYGHPHPRVVARYRQQGVRLNQTARDGAIRVDLGAGGVQVSGFRHRARRYFHDAPL
ncbi:MAG: DNA internalization-related competence protein ComEC/Rec2 [Gammaproteobacteria bacterium]|nr:DNA internalization-related competence protein ComEC/Rec2 [Gammaproteobacteria bacterium]